MKGENNLVFHTLEGYSGLRLRGGKPLTFKPGINLLIGRNGSGKTNLIRLVQQLIDGRGDLTSKIESSLIIERLKTVLNKKKGTIQSRFGGVIVVDISFQGKKGGMTVFLKQNMSYDVAANNIIRTNRTMGSIDLIVEPVKANFRQIPTNQNIPKLERYGAINSRVLSPDHNNESQVIMDEPINSVSEFVRNQMLQVFQGDEFLHRMKELEHSINSRFSKFLGTTNKTISINHDDIGKTGEVYLSLFDSGNYIQSADVSTGEGILLNLVFSLAAARKEQCKVLVLDEPDIHMHDDMIQILVNELQELALELPNCIIIVSTHSTVAIEKIAALNAELINIITFDNSRSVGNSTGDIDLINALSRNGVSFSPLMISKRRNIFIENQFPEGKAHRDFLLKFFPEDDKPNIIPIGTSGNVDENQAFANLFEEILRVSKLHSVGIQDGDIWFKKHLVDYLTGNLSLSSFSQRLLDSDDAFIKCQDRRKQSYYFNFWEIENLYLMPELLTCWKLKNGNSLTEKKFTQVLHDNRQIVINEYFNTFYKSVTRIRTHDSKSIGKTQLTVRKKLKDIHALLDRHKGIEYQMDVLIDLIFAKKLLHWTPGKEIKKLIQKIGYEFDDRDVNFHTTTIGEKIQQIF